jgi:hypothetical protein
MAFLLVARDRCASHVAGASAAGKRPGGLYGAARQWKGVLMARKLPLIEVGFHVFPQGGDEEVGAVREVAPGGRPELVVDIENAGDFVIPLDAVTEVVEEKVIVDPKKLPERVVQAMQHAHDAEDYP